MCLCWTSRGRQTLLKHYFFIIKLKFRRKILNGKKKMCLPMWFWTEIMSFSDFQQLIFLISAVVWRKLMEVMLYCWCLLVSHYGQLDMCRDPTTLWRISPQTSSLTCREFVLFFNFTFFHIYIDIFVLCISQFQANYTTKSIALHYP